MTVLEDQIIHKAQEFDKIGDWPQPFDAFVPPGETQAHTDAAIRELDHEGRLSILGFEADGMDRVDVVIGLGPKIPHTNRPGPGEHPYPGRPRRYGV
ncbi:hypothetical protein KIH74_09415 [Kineosporia sp. J2-2]|uniref:Uncharacterized protein n=1 Tax=Kineosporia corallincola TaxID=2835133 RepID=A0ABS5TG18_9ACTN|nr:hypothetical protein [Kineosporia corallincola]MBT0769136.1 hypothetical protein [Kineosporia corallincola]